MPNEKKYWKGLDERDATPEFEATKDREFTPSPTGTNGEKPTTLDRRAFLMATGFGLFATTVTAYQGSVESIVSGVISSENAVPGKAYHYATFCQGCTANCGVVAKIYDGRPIKLEGNTLAGPADGRLCAIGQAGLLGLYDSHAQRYASFQGKEISWDDADAGIVKALGSAGGAVVVLSETVTSPTLRDTIDSFLGTFSSSRHVEYDPISASAILDAHELSHGVRVLPRYRFDKAQVIVSFDADFLGTWISPVEFTAAYQEGRTLEKTSHGVTFSRHLQFESHMSLTGSNADRRIAVAPQQLPVAVAHVAAGLAKKAGVSLGWGSLPEWTGSRAILDEAVAALWKARGHALVVSGSRDVAVQSAVNLINELISSYGSTVDIDAPSYQKAGSDADLAALVKDMEAGKVGALFIHGVNPAYDNPHAAAFAAALKKVKLVVSLADRADETGALAQYLCPDHHFLEAWSDGQPNAEQFVLGQPTIHPLGSSRSALESFAAWSGSPAAAKDLLQAYWKKNVFPRVSGLGSFDAFWSKAVHDGGVSVRPAVRGEGDPVPSFAVARVKSPKAAAVAAGSFALVTHAHMGMFDGRHAHNPWLQELPDPVTKITWENAASISEADASSLGVVQGDIVRLEAAGAEPVELPVYIQPGQAVGTVSVPFGYGRKDTDRFAEVGPQWWECSLTVEKGQTIGTNVFPLAGVASVKVTKTGRSQVLACTQTYHSLTVPEHLGGHEPRPIVQETTLGEWEKDPSAGKPHHAHPEGTLWKDDFEYTGNHWGLTVDLSRCTGCSACLISCQAENNVPVVGKDEIARGREMHWIRIDRYYAETEEGVDTVHQPMMCHHCDNAPCEVVCPVLATVHSDEGLNQQVYNRCVGTRYCANNCPYKVRRFNWFDYPHEDEIQNLALNPDITVRTRGVMEKCSLCVQRIQEAKSEAIRRGMDVPDGAIQTACQQSCPASAIIFGDLNDAESGAKKAVDDPRHYYVLEELNVRPTVGYMRVIRNRAAGSEGEHHD
jgi:molybdopterin-containing oxidoreductase family iron-sulfur binding subunit